MCYDETFYDWLLHAHSRYYHSTCITNTRVVHALSSAEAELYAMGACVPECLNATPALDYAGMSKRSQTRLRTESSSGKPIAARLCVTNRARHLQLRCLFVQHAAHEGAAAIRDCPGADGLADIATTHVTTNLLRRHAEHGLGFEHQLFGVQRCQLPQCPLLLWL